MPSVRVRPTLRVELKHRIMNCKLPSQKKELEENKVGAVANIENLNDKVLKAMQNRANIGGTFK